jgi:energy-converting hydrogenase Eha subunit A
MTFIFVQGNVMVKQNIYAMIQIRSMNILKRRRDIVYIVIDHSTSMNMRLIGAAANTVLKHVITTPEERNSLSYDFAAIFPHPITYIPIYIIFMKSLCNLYEIFISNSKTLMKYIP